MREVLEMRIKQVMDGQDVLFGVPMGRQCCARLLEGTTEPANPAIVYLDFEGIASATVSFLREGPLAYRQHLRGRSSNLYPVFANLAPPVKDSLGEFLAASRDAVFTCDLTPGREGENPEMIGHLEPKQRLTFDAVMAAEVATAAELASAADDEDEVSVTAWNNRLAALVQKGLLIETREGRKKTFRSLFAKEVV
jgi:hypothetical protein